MFYFLSFTFVLFLRILYMSTVFTSSSLPLFPPVLPVSSTPSQIHDLFSSIIIAYTHTTRTHTHTTYTHAHMHSLLRSLMQLICVSVDFMGLATLSLSATCSSSRAGDWESSHLCCYANWWCHLLGLALTTLLGFLGCGFHVKYRRHYHTADIPSWSSGSH